jgi:hemolysin III
MKNFNNVRFSFGEELANAISHGLGLAFSIVATILLLVRGANYGSGEHIVSFSIFGASMINLYLSSTLNHSLRSGTKAKDFFHNYDQIAIYLLIAGTYTPMALVVMKGNWGWTMFGLEWGLAIAGILVKSILPNKYERGVNIFVIISFIMMGWMLLFFLIPLFQGMHPMGMGFIFIGGACYTLGVIFFKLEGKMPYAHLVWHLFVLAGTVCHWLAIFQYVAPLEV